MEQKLPTLQGHLRSSRTLIGVDVPQSLVFMWCLVDNFLAFVLSVVGSYCIGGEMVSVLASNAVDRGFERRSGQTKDY